MQTEKKIKITLGQYLESDIFLSEQKRFAFSMSFSSESDKSFEDWKKFFEDK